MVVRTVNDVFQKVSSRGTATAWRWLDSDAQWKPITSSEVYGRVHALASQLAEWGIQKGDRVALMAENRWEWPVTDFAVLSLGAVDVPLYPTLTPDQIGYMLRDSAAKVAVVSTREMYEKVRAAGDLPALEHLVVMDAGNFEGAESFSSLIAPAPSLQQRDADFDAIVQAVQPEDLATIIYTSGTTGEPKGVMLTHGNLGSNLSVSTLPFGLNEKDTCISFLPLSHVTARHLDYALMLNGSTIAYCPKFDYLPKAMNAIQPTVFVAVPRVFEKIRQAVETRATGIKKKILNWALGVGRKNSEQIVQGKQPGSLSWKLANKLAFSKIAEAFGGRVRLFIAGGAPLGLDTGTWFAGAGIRIFEGYGLTETSPVIALNTPERNRLGTVGPVLENLQVRFASDGELEVKGPSIFHGYWNKPDERAKVFTPDGWFCTGDIGKLEDGFLSITDRKKELLKTSGGKFIAPQPIENKLKASTLVGIAALVGDKHKFACVLISPNFPALESWAKGQGVTTSSREALVKDSRVIAEYQSIVSLVNKTLAPYETIKRIAVVPHEWSVEEGELTPSMKLKRRVVEKKYEAEIAEMYKDEATATKEQVAAH